MPLIRRLLGERRDLFASRSLIPPPWVDAPQIAGLSVSDDMALRASAVWACTSLISDAIATLPVDAFRRNNDARMPIEPAPRLLTDPHAEQDRPDWISRIALSLLLWGNAYGLVLEEDRGGFPTQILPVHPRQVDVQRNRQTGEIEYRLGTNFGEPKLAWPAGDIWHVRDITLPGEVVGISRLELARQPIGLALAAERFGAQFFGEGAVPSGLIKVPHRLTQEQADRVKLEWERAHNNRRSPAVLAGGIEFEPIQISNESSQFMETRAFQVAEICRIFRVPTHLVGDASQTTVWGTGVEQLGLAFVTYTLQPWLVRLETALSKLLPRPQFVKFNVAGLLRGDVESRFRAYAIGRQQGWLSVNEVRALEDLPPLERESVGDVFIQQANAFHVSGDRPQRPVEGPETPAEPMQVPAMPPAPGSVSEPATTAVRYEAGDWETAALLAELRHADERARAEGAHAEELAVIQAELRKRDEEIIRLRTGRRVIVRRNDEGLIEGYEECPDGPDGSG